MYRWRRLAFLLILLGATNLFASSFEECEAGLRLEPAARKTARCFYETVRERGAWEGATTRLEALWLQHPQRPWFAFYLGHVNWFRDPPRAVDSYRSAAEGLAELGDAAGELEARDYLGRLLLASGRADEARSEIERATRAAAASGDPDLEAHALVMSGHRLIRTEEDLPQAIRILKRAEALLFPDGPAELQQDCLLDLGNGFLALGRYGDALHYFQRLAVLLDAGDDVNLVAAARYNIAHTMRLQLDELPRPGGRQELLRLARETLVIAYDSAHRGVQSSSHRMLGDLLQSGTAADREEARQHYDECLHVARGSQLLRETVYCLWALGRFLAESEPARAGELIDEGLALALDRGTASDIAFAWRERMRLSWESRPKHEAIRDSLNTLAAIETFRDLQVTSGARAEVFSAWSQDYYFFSGRLLQGFIQSQSEEDLALAFEVIERLRARMLLEALTSMGSSEPSPDALREQRVEVLRQIVEVQRRLLHPHLSDDQRQTAVAELESLEIQYEDLSPRAEVALRTPALLHGSAVASLEEIEESLASDEAVLSFQISLWEDAWGRPRRGSWLAVITREGTRPFALPGRERLDPAVSIFAGLFDRRDEAEVPTSVRLHGLLLAEAVRELPSSIEKLILIPDGVLHRLPFGVLRASEGGETLLERFELSVVPSATLWLRWRQLHTPPTPVPALALVDPVGVNAATGGGVAAERQWPWTRGALLGALPHARAEGRAVRRYLGGGSRVLSGEEATERFVKEEDLSQFGVLHFAAHAVVDEETPDRSAILLAPGASAEDGLLQSREIAQLNLRDRAVVLSACRTAAGQVLHGEGVMGLARAFFQAGARVVVASLWPVRDDEAAMLFEAFYRHLADGETVAGALGMSQRQALKAGQPAAAWAGFVVLGDGTWTPFPEGRPWWVRWQRALLPALSVLALALLLSFFVRRLRH